MEPELITRIKQLKDRKNWELLISVVDSSIKKYQVDREKRQTKCFQFANFFEFYYYIAQHGGNLEWVNNDEFKLLQVKLYALVELGDEAQAEKVIYELLKLSPYSVPVMFEMVELAKRKKDLVAFQRYMELIYPHIWDARDFGRFLRLLSWLSIEEKDFQSAIYYLSWSLGYDKSEKAQRYVEYELSFIAEKLNLNYITRPKYQVVYDYFVQKGLVFEPKTENIAYNISLYEHCKNNEESLGKQIVDYAKENLKRISFGLSFRREK